MVHNDYTKGIVILLYCHIFSFVTGLTNAFAKGVKLNGGSVFEDCPVSNINLNSTNAVKSVSVGNHQVITVFENHRKSLIQHCERSELFLYFEWTKVH